MSERDQKLYLTDIVESINAIQSFVVNCDFTRFCNDRKTFSATIRELEIIDEAISNVSDEIKAQHPDVLWREIRSFRNMITHEYFGIDSRIVWDIIQNELELLLNQINKILASLTSS